MLCSRNRVDKLGDIAEHLVPLDDETIAEFAQTSGEPMPPPEVKGCNAAYIIFTSGSTGEPKVGDIPVLYSRDSNIPSGDFDGT
jgi:acyl-coenzyme A synthetase/AMP-(fatty) acid ligase